MRNRLLKSFTVVAACCMMLAVASPSFAQSRSQYFNRSNVERLVRQAEMHTNQFAVAFDRALDRSRLDDTVREGRLNERANELRGQLNNIRMQLNRRGDFSDVRPQVSSALEVGQRLNNAMRIRRVNFGFGVERQWSLVRADLNRLASIFNLRQLS